MRILREEHLYEFANLIPKKTGLKVQIWAEHSGVKRNNSHNNTPRIKLTKDPFSISITIEENPKVKAKSRNLKVKDINRLFSDGIKYVGKNYDLFLKHYMDTTDDFDDEDLFNALREKGEYK